MLIVKMIAILSCVSFAGIAIYINLAEHPARLECGTKLASTVFGPSYRRAAAIQASLALIATIFGISLAFYSSNYFWLVGALFIFFVVPFTFIAIMPTNKRLLTMPNDRSLMETEALLKKWGALHAVRSISSSIAAILYVYLGVTP